MKTVPKIINIPSRIGKLIPEGKLTVFTGLPGIGKGKAYSIIKFLNENTIQPILFNMGNDFALDKLDLSASSNDPSELSSLVGNEYTNIKNSVIVIDNYVHCKGLFGINSTKSQEYFVHQLQTLCATQDCTIIMVVDHPHDAFGSAGIFDDNQSLVRNCYEHLHLHIEINKRTKPVATHTPHLYVTKGRNIGGSKVIKDWMKS